MKLNSFLPFTPNWARANLTASTILFTLLTSSNFILAQHHTNHNSQSALDEEITIESSNDYEKTFAEQKASQSNHEVNLAADGKQSTVQLFDHNDPFAVTFEDYYRETSRKSPTNHKATINSESSYSPTTAISDKVDLIIEEDDNSVIKPKDSPVIDYIFPPSNQDTVNQRPNVKQTKAMQLERNDTNSNELINEIKLLFAWKQLPTNKCSKACGKGFRVNHISCVDVKYDVRVEDDLCHKAKIAKPNETSDETCNEIDCPSQWISIEFQECNPAASQEGICQPNLYKRVQCTMINKSGSLVYLDESKCSLSQKPVGLEKQTNETKTVDVENKSTRNTTTQSSNDDNVDLSFDEVIENRERNDILSNIDSTSSISRGSTLHSFSEQNMGNNIPNEPFFETGPWSECSGALCGRLGKRTRKVTCHLYLSRTSRFVDLPDSSCHHLQAPDHQEPCYIDCPPEPRNSSLVSFGSSEMNDETVYDLEMTRFVWRKGDWTKCSADCLGGRRESIIECWDTIAETIVEVTSCVEELKPQIVTETCNEIACEPEWRIGAFSKCTKPCGSSGIKSRSITCVQQVSMQDGTSYQVVPNDQCIRANGSIPHNLEPCNRVDCKPEWSVEPWSECSNRCGGGVKNRTVICVQEFANKDGPRPESSHKKIYRIPDKQLQDAIAISSNNWHPGKATQVPFQECYEEYRTVPALEERCFNFCEEPFIDSDAHQNYRMTQEALKRKTVTLKIGGKAQVLEGRNLKIRCKIMNRHVSSDLVKKIPDNIEWRKDGIKIFLNGSTMADKQYTPDDNSILNHDILMEEKNQFLADEPSLQRSVRLAGHSNHRQKNLRSWNNYHSSQNTETSFNFVPQVGGRFSIVRENTLRIKRLRPDDVGTYTCSYGSLNDTLELNVIGKREFADTDERFANNQRMIDSMT